jgi:hypothetical protein
VLAAQALFTSQLTPAFQEYELKDAPDATELVAGRLALAAPTDGCGSGGVSWVRPTVPNSLNMSPTVAPRRLRGFSSLGAVVLLKTGITARGKAGLEVGFPASMMVLSLFVAFVEFVPFSKKYIRTAACTPSLGTKTPYPTC